MLAAFLVERAPSPRRAGKTSCGGDEDVIVMTSYKYVWREIDDSENIIFTVSAGTREDVECGSLTAEIGVGMDVVRVFEAPAVTTFCRVSADPKREFWLPISNTPA